MNWQEAITLLNSGKKLKRKDWKKKCICSILNPIDLIPWRTHPLMAKKIESHWGKTTDLNEIWLFENGDTIYPRWHPTAKDMDADDWEIAYPKLCTCSVCKSKFDFGDEQSPVLNDNLWNTVINFYGLEEINRLSKPDYRGETQSSPVHCYVCYECMEKALGRELTLDDIPSVIYNVPFKKYILGKNG